MSIFLSFKKKSATLPSPWPACAHQNQSDIAPYWSLLDMKLCSVSLLPEKKNTMAATLTIFTLVESVASKLPLTNMSKYCTRISNTDNEVIIPNNSTKFINIHWGNSIYYIYYIYIHICNSSLSLSLPLSLALSLAIGPSCPSYAGGEMEYDGIWLNNWSGHDLGIHWNHGHPTASPTTSPCSAWTEGAGAGAGLRFSCGAVMTCVETHFEKCSWNDLTCIKIIKMSDDVWCASQCSTQYNKEHQTEWNNPLALLQDH